MPYFLHAGVGSRAGHKKQQSNTLTPMRTMYTLLSLLVGGFNPSEQKLVKMGSSSPK